MAKKSKEKEIPTLLPIPKPILDHHLSYLKPLMQQWQSKNRIPPVLLLTGIPGVGKSSLVHYLSQWLLCESSQPENGPSDGESSLFGNSLLNPSCEPCGTCSACQRAMKNQWIDFTEISSESEEGESTSLKIDQFRRLRETQGFGSFSGTYKITLIRNAERMTPQAANSLLKILEEPPPNWIFFLTASDPTLLLTTIVSRCQVVRLKPIPHPALESWLIKEGEDAPRARSAVQFAQGSWGKALELCHDETIESRARILKTLEGNFSEMGALVDWAVADQKNFELLINQMDGFISDLIKWNQWGENTTQSPIIGILGERMKKHLGSGDKLRSFCFQRAERNFQIRAEMLAPLNRKILAQDILLPWLNSR